MEINLITSRIIKCAIEVHKKLGPGLLESSYEECLVYELINDGLSVRRQMAVLLRIKCHLRAIRKNPGNLIKISGV